MSDMASAPLREIAVRAFEVRDHRSLLARNLRLKQSRFQAPRRAGCELAQEPCTPTDRRAPPLLMARTECEVQAVVAPTSPLANPMQRVPKVPALWANEPSPIPVISTAADRHRPRP